MNFAHWTTPQRELWARLQAFDLDEPGASLDFSRRLARENGWTHPFAKRVVEEYKRFLFLAMSAGHPVTPSDEVDQAWHLHLVYTRSYWDELCADVLCAPLHHGPTRGGAREGAKFGEWYAKTLASYARFFGADAPAEVWPDAQTRFGETTHFRRINARRHWIVEKPRLQWRAHFSPALLVVLALLGAGGVAWGAQLGWNVWNWYGPEFLTLFWLLTFAGFAGIIWAHRTWNVPHDEQLPLQKLDAYSIARLSDEGENLPIDAALAHMIQDGRIGVESNGVVSRIGAMPTDDWERLVWDKIGVGTRQIAMLRAELKPSLNRFDGELERLGLFIAPAARAQIGTISVMVPTLLLMLGGSKILVGLSRGRPVGFLLISCVLVLVAMAIAWSNVPRRSRRGDAFLERLRATHRRGSLSLPPLSDTAPANDAATASALVLGMALWGANEMDAFGLGQQRRLMQPPPASSGGSSDGGCSSDSGGCGGGGCGGGGCGGCGS